MPQKAVTRFRIVIYAFVKHIEETPMLKQQCERHRADI